MSALIGQSLGRYQILEQLCEGGMATVYKAYDSTLDRFVAIKVIRTDQFAPSILDEILKRFEREAKALAERDVSRLREQLEAREEEFDAIKAEVIALKKDREEVRARVEKMLAHMDALIEEEQA